MRQFHWTPPATSYKFRHLVAHDSDDVLGHQIVAEISLRRERFGRQKHCYQVRVWWDRGPEGIGPCSHRDVLPNGSEQGAGYPRSWATVGNVAKAHRWAEDWLARWLWEWDGCEVVTPASEAPAPVTR